MTKRLVIIAIAAIMMLGVFGLAGCDKDIKTGDALKQGVYSTDDDMFCVELYGENSFSLHIMFMSHLPTGNYNVDNGKLVLNYTNDSELVFDIGDNRLTFLGTNTGGQFAEEGLIIVGSVFNLTFYEESADDMIELHTWYFTSGLPNNAIKVKHSDENAFFECIVDNGGFGFGVDNPKIIEVKSGETFYWHTTGNPNAVSHAYIDIIVRVDENIVGFAVVGVSLKVYSPYSSHHEAKVISAILFPKQDGQYQRITNEQIKNKIEQIKIENGGK